MEPGSADYESIPFPSSKVALGIRTPGTDAMAPTINLSQQACVQTKLASVDQGSSMAMVVGSVRYDDVCVCVCVCVCVTPTSAPRGSHQAWTITF